MGDTASVEEGARSEETRMELLCLDAKRCVEESQHHHYPEHTTPTGEHDGVVSCFSSAATGNSLMIINV